MSHCLLSYDSASKKYSMVKQPSITGDSLEECFRQVTFNMKPLPKPMYSATHSFQKQVKTALSLLLFLWQSFFQHCVPRPFQNEVDLTISPGDRLQFIIGKGQWIMFQAKNGQRGWVPSTHVTLVCLRSPLPVQFCLGFDPMQC